MSGGSEHFVKRWSRLKRRSADGAKRQATVEPKVAAALGRGATPAAVDDRDAANRDLAAPEKVDLSALPSVESITAETDIRAFLQAGVPGELTKAALRRVWTADPAIRDFIGIAENQWDFTDPNAIPGFGSLDAANLEDLVNQALGKMPAPSSGDQVVSAASTSREIVDSAPRGEAEVLAQDKAADTETTSSMGGTEFAAAQQTDASNKVPERANRRPHGRAVPQ